MQDFNKQRGLVAKVLASSVRVTLTSGPRVGHVQPFPRKNLSKVVHTGMEGAEQAHAPEHQSATKKRAAASCSDDEHASKKAAHAPASPPGDLV
jgi:hypothetical protein